MLTLFPSRLVALLTLSSAFTFAAETVFLSTGQNLLVDRHEREGTVVRLHKDGGVMDLPASMVVAYEAAPDPPPAPIAPPIPEPVVTPMNLSTEDLLRLAAEKHGLPYEFVRSVAMAESALNPEAISHKGAIGVMQLMPETAADLSADPFDTAQNIEAGVRYLRDLLVRYQHRPDQVHLALAAYNAGPGAVDRHRGVPPYRETVTYIRRVLAKYLATAGKS